MPSAEELAFLARIREQPDDDGPRLIFADWLDERGDPRGEFIRVQCALARLAPDDPRLESIRVREQELLDQHKATWLNGLPGLDFVFRRGLLNSVTIEAEAFLERGKDLFCLGPIRHVRFLDAARNFTTLMQLKLLGSIRELDLTQSFIGNNGITAIAGARHLSRLEVLCLGFNDITDQGLRQLADIAHLVNLRVLSLCDNRQISTPGVRALADSPHFANLRQIDLSGNGLSETAIKVLVNGEFLKKLDAVALQGNNIGDGGVEALANSDLLRRMLAHSPVLDLSRNNIGPLGARALAESPLMETLETLNLDINSIGDAGLRALAGSPHLVRLQRLCVAENRIGDAGLLALARSDRPRTLTFIGLTGNFVTFDSISALDEAATGFDWRKEIKKDLDPGTHLRAIRPSAG